jgi:DNA-binding transcriptional regulator YdaS (Cro superfamily)
MATDKKLTPSIRALEKAIAIFETQDLLAAALKIRSPSISGWKKSKIVPYERCADIERVTDGRVTRAELRPDIWGNPEQKAA